MNRSLKMILVTMASPLLFAVASSAPASPVAGVTLLDLSGHKQVSGELSVAPLAVFIAGGSGCPVMRRYLPELNTIFANWRERGVRFYLIDVAAQDDLKAARDEYRVFHPDFPVYLDPKQALGKKIGFKVTGEIAIVDPTKNRIVYQGAIDDRYLLGEDRHQAKENYLVRALSAWSAGKPISEEKHRAFGCAITYRD